MFVIAKFLTISYFEMKRAFRTAHLSDSFVFVSHQRRRETTMRDRRRGKGIGGTESKRKGASEVVHLVVTGVIIHRHVVDKSRLLRIERREGVEIKVARGLL